MADVQPIQRRGEKPTSNISRKPPPKGTDQKHPAGIFADMATDGPLIGTLVAVVDKAKNLPNLKSIGKQDPYCVLRLGKHVKKTEPDKRGGQTPKWDAELRFPVHDSGDYRNLKVVIFTDDKKTELIGECVLNLDTILDTAGGGQSDGWHQCKCRGRYAGDIRIELTFWDERPRESAPLIVNTRQVTGFEKEDFKRPEKSLAGPRRPGAPPRKRELPERPNPKPSKENLAPSSPEEEEEEPELPVAHHRKERHRDREPRERHRDDRGNREHRRGKSRHQREREAERPSHDEYAHDPYHQNSSHHITPYDTPQDQFGYYQNQGSTLQDFQSDHIGQLQAQYAEQTQLVHQRHPQALTGYSGYQNPQGDYYDQQQQWQNPHDQNMGMVLANQNGPPVLPQHKHVEFADTRRSMGHHSPQPPPQPQQALHHRKSRSEFYSNGSPDVYQQKPGNNYSNQLVSSSSFAPAPPRHHGYDQQYQEQPSFGNQGFDQPQVTSILPKQQTPIAQYQSKQQIGLYQQSFQDPYIDQGYQSQLARASDFAPPLPPQHSQAAASYQTASNPRDDFSNNSALMLSYSSTPAPPPPTHRSAQPRMSMPASVPAALPTQLPPAVQAQVPNPQPLDMYEQNFQLQSLRGFAPPQLPTHGGSQFQAAAPPQPAPVQEQTIEPRARGISEPPPYASLNDNGTSFQQTPEPQSLDFGQQEPASYEPQQSYPANTYTTPTTSTPAYTSFTDYSQAGIPLSQRLADLHLPPNPEHAFDPTTALVLAGGNGPPPPLSHTGASSPLPAHRGRNHVPPISTNIPPKKAISRSPSPHPLSLTPGFGPESPGDDDIGSRSPVPFSLTQTQPVEPVPVSNYHAPYVKDVTGRRSMDSRLSYDSTAVSPLIQPTSQPIDANRRRSVSPMPPLNSYSQELVSARGAPPPLPQASHRVSQHLVYKHDPSENPSESRSNRSSAYEYPGHMQSSQMTHNNHSIPGAQTSDLNSSSAPIPVATAGDSKTRQPYIEDEIDETDRCADSTYQSASTSWATSQSVDDISRDHMSHSSYDVHSKQPPSRNMNRSPYPDYNQDGHYSNQQNAIMKPRATSPMPPRRNSDIPPIARTPEPQKPASVRPEQRRMTLGGMPFSPDDYDVINPVSSSYNSGSRSPSGNVSTMPLARSPGAISISPGQYMTPKEEKKARKEEEKAARKARRKVYTPGSANRSLEDDDILAPDTFAPEPERRNSFNAGAPGYGDDDVQPLSFRPRRQSASPQPPGADIYGTSPGGGGYKGGSKSIASNTSSAPSSGYNYGAPQPTSGHRPLPGAPVMRNAIMGPDDYYHQQQGGYAAPPPPSMPPMRIPQSNPGNMTQEQWSLSQELSSISIGTSSRRRTGTWA
ncbi:hypothetical protein H072_6430 [Dactylellina haptotyla CBS 200.50]|uniref:C2 domain-containing protein n=1 Tax=Dactylellina haptotyla (strain CBS 200.50) TaxID=1284197 RepID=S8AF46_DACHA|nr:hypothetical protein H072_6430 [Dactylellina haptotyla CBS 200.50]